MGQGHSAPQPGTAESTSKGVEKKDYYELLEVEQDASPEEFVLPCPLQEAELI